MGPSAPRAVPRNVTPPLADFAIVGVQKGGTTALRWHMHTSQPAVCVYEHELHVEHGMAGRLATLQRQCGGRRAALAAAGRRKPVGFVDPILSYYAPIGSASLLHAWLPALKLVLLLREPIARAHSQWRMEVDRISNRASRLARGEASAWDARSKHFNGSATFAELVATELRRHSLGQGHTRRAHTDVVARGLYHEQVLALAARFPSPRQLHIAVSERVRDDTLHEYNRIFAFLNVPSLGRLETPPSHAATRTSSLGSQGEAADPRLALSNATIVLLYRVYYASTEALYGLLRERIREWEGWYAAHVPRRVRENARGALGSAR